MLNAAIVGMGRWGQTLVDSVQGSNAGPLRFVAGCTRTPAKAETWAAERGVRMLADYAAVLADPEVQAVVLATPHSQHVAHVIAAAAAGRHVFVEKPFTLDKAGAEAAVAACARAGVVLALGHNRRFLPAVLEMKRLLAEAALGTVLHAEGHISGPAAAAWREGMWRADREESPLGGMAGMGIHMVDMLVNLLGPIAEVTVASFPRVSAHVDDTTAMLARFAGGAMATFATLSLAPRYWRVALFGTRAMLEMQGQDRLVFVSVTGDGGWTRDFPPIDIERAELLAFAAAVAGEAPYPLPVAEAIHGVSVYETMIAAAASGSRYAVP